MQNTVLQLKQSDLNSISYYYLFITTNFLFKDKSSALVTNPSNKN